MTRLLMIDGIDHNNRYKLQRVGIRTVESLLQSCQNSENRELLAEKARIPQMNLEKWVNQADLTRIRGVGGEFAKLLEAIEVISVAALARQEPEALLEKMAAANAVKKHVRKIPTMQKIESWIEQARSLPPLLV